MKIDWKYPFIFQIDLKSQFKSLWLGWWLIVWEWDEGWRFPASFDISFQPGL